MIEVANPNAGAPNQGAAMLVYQTWTPDDCKKVCADIPKPDVNECIEQLQNLLRSYHKNGTDSTSLDDSRP